MRTEHVIGIAPLHLERGDDRLAARVFQPNEHLGAIADGGQRPRRKAALGQMPVGHRAPTIEFWADRGEKRHGRLFVRKERAKLINHDVCIGLDTGQRAGQQLALHLRPRYPLGR